MYEVTTAFTLRCELEALQARLDIVRRAAERVATADEQYRPIARRVREMHHEGGQLWHITQANLERSHR